jgi:hypothetical protein
MTIETQITAARNEVRKHAFGTAAYEAAFARMSELTKSAADNYKGEYTSVDGNIFAPR